ncbi:PucR family transcriptional regulator [Streptomyces sp. YC504]|uniref:PucR family transcriptional regulator n=1 Tax=Streptomyces mesophilus TaxID=1775132 RepID=A0A6G4XF83_9ACTN|nr:PucR family transcriptional regulator [Streptomyces mesophilus]NGO76199.1 PucR family transcriptional regulator [Streptomyces mesophilus]
MAARGPRTKQEWKVLAETCEALLTRLQDLVDGHLRLLDAHSPTYEHVIPYDQHWQQAETAMRIGIEALCAPKHSPRRDLEYAESMGRRSAQQGLPLNLLVHAYRQAGRLVWDELLAEAQRGHPERLPVLMQSASMVWSAVNDQEDTLSEAYRATELELRRRTDERLQALLDALLDGQDAPELTSRAAAGLDLPEQGRYAVVVLPLDRRDGSEPLHRLIRATGVRFVWRMRADCELGVAALDTSVGLDALSGLLEAGCTGPGGISPVVGGLAELGRARRLAELALRTCPPDSTAIVRLDRRVPTALVVGQPELAGRLVKDVFGPLLSLDPADRAVLLETLNAWLDCEGSAGRAAGRLYCHRNTVFNRLRRLEQLTGRDLSRPRDLTEMTLALDAHRLAVGS